MATPGENKQASTVTSARWIRVLVTDLKTGGRKANVKVPLGMVEFGLKMGAKFAPKEVQGLDLNQLLATAKAGGQGKVVDVEDEEKGEYIEVFIE